MLACRTELSAEEAPEESKKSQKAVRASAGRPKSLQSGQGRAVNPRAPPKAPRLRTSGPQKKPGRGIQKGRKKGTESFKASSPSSLCAVCAMRL